MLAPPVALPEDGDTRPRGERKEEMLSLKESYWGARDSGRYDLRSNAIVK